MSTALRSGGHSHFQLKHDHIVQLIQLGKQKLHACNFLHVLRNIPIDLATNFTAVLEEGMQKFNLMHF